jgi:hypothetical protein
MLTARSNLGCALCTKGIDALEPLATSRRAIAQLAVIVEARSRGAAYCSVHAVLDEHGADVSMFSPPQMVLTASVSS